MTLFLDRTAKANLTLLRTLAIEAGLPDPARLCRLADDAVDYFKHPEVGPDPLAHLFDHWYRALPAWEVYDHPDYLAEAYVCWAEYSRRYLSIVRRKAVVPGLLPPVSSVLDLGCGLGFSTAVLTELFPQATVIGTNVQPSAQWDIGTALAQRYPFTLTPDPVPADLVFASEYFEHFPDPLAHLKEILAAVDPLVMIVASTFNQPAIGHFPDYNGMTGPEVSRAFGKAMRAAGYQPLVVRAWNNRPKFWVKAS